MGVPVFNLAVGVVADRWHLKDDIVKSTLASFHLVELEIDRLSNSVLDLIDSRQFDKAEAVCQKLLKQFPDQVDGLERSVQVYRAKGDYALAAEYARRAIVFMKERAGEYDPDLIAEMEDELRQFESHLT